MIVALIALTALVTFAGLTVMSIQGGITAVSSDRSKSVALYIAESGAAAGADYVRKNVKAAPVLFSDLVEPNNVAPQRPADIIGNGALPGTPLNMFSADMNAWYEVEILNNVDDPGFATGADTDRTVIVRATGHGPGGARAQVELYVKAEAITGLGPPCNGYAQGNQNAANSGTSNCDTLSNLGDVATYAPGAP
ncbi:MAG: hypothetical protein R3B06_11375 [Kofleriaceae bacterium]